MSPENVEKKTIPPEFEDMLLKFTIQAVVERPQDLTSFASDYFTCLRDRQASGKEVKFRESSKEFIASVLGKNIEMRRGTVMLERCNPEEDAEDDGEIEINPKSDEERKRIKEQAQDIFLFRVLDDVDFSAVIDAMMRTPVKKGKTVIRQGDDGDFFYLIDEGNFDVFIKDKSREDKYIATYEGKGFFGELALLHNQPRAATIKAATDGVLWAMSRHTFNRLIVKRAFEKRQMYMKLLEGVPRLKPLTEYEKMQVADALQGKSYSKDEIILHEGDGGNGMYFIVEGKVSVKQKSEDGSEDKEIAQLRKGEFFGGSMADTDTQRPVSSSPYDHPPRRISVNKSERYREESDITIDIDVDEDTNIEELPVYLFPFTRIKVAWDESTNNFQFIRTAVCIIFETVGWFTCVGGIPLMSLVMLVIGSIYVNDCNIEPNIPVYLIVSGVMGTIQHVLNVWTQYVPKESEGDLKVYRDSCECLHGALHLFLMIWFILGCVWVYGAYSDVEYADSSKREYCHKTLYLFSFWILNLSFILFGLLILLSICLFVAFCMIASFHISENINRNI